MFNMLNSGIYKSNLISCLSTQLYNWEKSFPHSVIKFVTLLKCNPLEPLFWGLLVVFTLCTCTALILFKQTLWKAIREN